ncbi:hypothetical protein [Candidatus Lokiarchaeum ossiferum]|uniref:hypothetical protein n=1 Tax=Candidatus Lokiarchaeum ossiferum TaxID=2951803 RepID=UPI00352CD034
MSDVAAAVVKTTKQATSVKPSNPLIQFSIGGVGSAAGIWVFSKVYGFMGSRFPALMNSQYSKPLAKAATALVMYSFGNLKSVRKIPLARTFFFGSGIGIFGSMVSDYVITKVAPVLGKAKSSLPSTGGKLASKAPTAPNRHILKARSSGISRMSGKIFGV